MMKKCFLYPREDSLILTRGALQVKHNHYIEHVNRVLDYIDKHISKPLTLEELSGVGNFSKFHFHRIFFAIIGESLFQYILRLRLEKCASVMLMEPGMKLSELSFRYGFSDLAVFSRHFKRHFKVTPSAYKARSLKKSNIHQMNRNFQHIEQGRSGYFCPEFNQINRTSNMKFIKNVEVKSLPAMTVAYVRNFGPYAGNDFSYEQGRNDLFVWAAARGLMNEEFRYLIVYHDNPNVALSDKLRMSLSVTVPPRTEVHGKIGKMLVDGGNYLVCECELATEDFPKVWEWIYGYWFPEHGYFPDDKPYYELYPEQPQGQRFKVNFCIPVKVKKG